MKRFIYPLVIVIVVVIFLIICIWIIGRCTTVLVIRHAERADGTPNSNLLDPEGLVRAQALVGVLSDADVAAIYTTDYCRTAQTGQFLAIELGLPLNVQQSGDPQAGLDNCEPEITVPISNVPSGVGTPAQMAEYVVSEHANQSVLIVGHSPTVPQMVAALGNGAFGPIGPVDNYDHMFIVELREWYGSPHLIKAQYGN